MKKLSLLLAAGLIATASNGQQAAKSVVFAPQQPMSHNSSKHIDLSKVHRGSGLITSSSVADTTGWFDYTDTVLAGNIAVYGISGDGVQLSSMYMWPDSSAIFGYDDAGTTGAVGYGIPSGNFYMVSTGMLLDPFAPDWTTGGSAISRPLITDTNSYIIDSVMVAGVYNRQASAMSAGSYTDHLNFSLVYGDGTSASNIPVFYFNQSSLLSEYGLPNPPDTALWTPDVFWDTTTNEAEANTGGPAVASFSEALTYQDTSVTNFGTYAYAVPGGFPVPAGNFAALTVSFQSGDTSYHVGSTAGTGDSITSQDGVTYYHGAFFPAISFAGNATDADFPPYLGPEPASTPINTGDFTTGFFKSIGSADGGWNQFYIPGWAWSSSAGGASYLQYPYIWFHVTCGNCTAAAVINAVPVVNNVENQVKVYPNPSTSVVTIAFALNGASDVNVSLTNMVGQVVATQKVTGTSTGSVQFNTSILADGMYFYTLNANTYTNIGHIVVAH